jgi:tartrate-resistant acid phosphatase type 5
LVGWLRACALLLTSVCLFAQGTYVYVGDITPESALIAWGNTSGTHGRNTIGRQSISMGPAAVRIDNRTLFTTRNWMDVRGLQPDTNYPYEIFVNDRRIGGGEVRTYPLRASRMTFFVIGDFGTGDANQRRIAQAMWKEYAKRAATANPVRFIITMGDNIYAYVNIASLIVNSGDQDHDWDAKFYSPYRELLQHIPFHPSLGNHDGNGSESRGDLTVYLDNFFFPENRPARYYTFSFGGLADFFALDSTDNTSTGPPAPQYGRNSPQWPWLQQALGESTAPWKIPYFHHPPFTAGPAHPSSFAALHHWMQLFERSGVKVVFTGHEHNLQFSQDNDATGHIRYIVSGAGGQLRDGDITKKMATAHIEGWAAHRHFLVVEIEGRTMRVTPVSYEPFAVQNSSHQRIPMPFVIDLP